MTDFKGTTTVTYLVGRKASYRFGKLYPLTEVRVGIQFENGDAYITWLPVFTEWF